MAEPFSTAAAAVGVADVAVRASKYVKKIAKTTKHLDKEVDALEAEIDKFNNVFIALSELCNKHIAQAAADLNTGSQNPCSALWRRAAELIREGKNLVEKLEDLLKSVLGDEDSARFQKVDDLRKAFRMVAKNSQYDKVRSRFSKLNSELNMMLNAIQLVSDELHRSQLTHSMEELPSKIAQELLVQLKGSIDVLDKTDPSLQPSIKSARAAIQYSSLNKFFDVRDADVSDWTGRQRYLDELRDSLLGSKSVDVKIQKRFIVHGIAGAGKTQFATKFASDYRESFWGVFSVDASNPESAIESWKKIAKMGGRDALEEAGKDWLSNSTAPWLLIVDNADTFEETLVKQFPPGDRGCVLVTTRNRKLKTNGTAGHLALDRMEEDEADELLRKITQHEPWDDAAKRYAAEIARLLEYLPLALRQAGKAIYHQLCTLSTYLSYFNRHLEDWESKKDVFVREKRSDEMGETGPFMTFEVIYEGLQNKAKLGTMESQRHHDAVELLNMFAFLHNNDICLEILTKAGKNIFDLAETENSKTLDQDTEPAPPPKTYLEQIQKWALAVVMKLQRPKPVLPSVLRGADMKQFDEVRARLAINLLVRMSLVSENSTRGSFSMHPLIHLWARKRLEPVSAQALWCETAANVLAGSVKLPPLVDEIGDQDYYLRIIPHVNHVQYMKMDVKTQLQCNRQQQGALRRLLPFRTPPHITVLEAWNKARYGRVYLQCTKFKEARELMRAVLDFVISLVGPDHPLCVRIQMPLATTEWHLGNTGEAQKLQEDALRICRAEFGDEHSQTLKITDALGHTLWQRGKLTQAKIYHKDVIKGLEGRPKLLREKAMAMVHLGHVQIWYVRILPKLLPHMGLRWVFLPTSLTQKHIVFVFYMLTYLMRRYWEIESARALYQEAAEILEEEFSDDDDDCLEAVCALGMAHFYLGGQHSSLEHMQRSYDMLQETHKKREEKMGHEHLYTLWAACYFARSSAALGELTGNLKLVDQAQEIYTDGLEICRRNLGPLHPGTLMGRQTRADALLIEKKYEEAEKEYREVAQRQKEIADKRDGLFRDRLWTLFMLAKCYEIQCKYEDAYQTSQAFLDDVHTMGGQNHIWRKIMLAKQDELKQLMQLSPTSSPSTPPSPISLPYFGTKAS
ncbi:MAG: hypothetical protein Q9162_004834 [Coniocarpon cinnabarinum]